MQPPHKDSSPLADANADRAMESASSRRKRPHPQAAKKEETQGKAGPVRIAATPATQQPRADAYRGKCLYQSRKCENERAVKRNGKPHNLCDEHRSKQNQHQRKFDAKKFSRKRRHDSLSDEEEAKAIDHVSTAQSSRKELPSGQEPHQKQRRVATYHATEARTPSHVASSPRGLTPLLTAQLARPYPPLYAASPSTPRLPSLQSPRGPLLPLPPSSQAFRYIQPSPRDAGGQQPLPRTYMAPQAKPRPSPRTTQPSVRPYLQQQDAYMTRVAPGYSHSELVAARILVQPSSALPPLSSPSPSSSRSPVYYRSEPAYPIQRPEEAVTTPSSYEPTSQLHYLSGRQPQYASQPSPGRGAYDGRGYAVNTPRLLPSLLVPPSGFQPNNSSSSSSVTPSAATAAASPAASTSQMLPSLTPFRLRRSTSSPSSPRN